MHGHCLCREGLCPVMWTNLRDANLLRRLMWETDKKLTTAAVKYGIGNEGATRQELEEIKVVKSIRVY